MTGNISDDLHANLDKLIVWYVIVASIKVNVSTYRERITRHNTNE